MSSPEKFTSAYSPHQEFLLRDLTAPSEGTLLPKEIKAVIYEGVTNLMNTLGMPAVTDRQRNIFQKSGGNDNQITAEQIAFLLTYIALSTELSEKTDITTEIDLG